VLHVGCVIAGGIPMHTHQWSKSSTFGQQELKWPSLHIWQIYFAIVQAHDILYIELQFLFILSSNSPARVPDLIINHCPHHCLPSMLTNTRFFINTPFFLTSIDASENSTDSHFLFNQIIILMDFDFVAILELCLFEGISK